VVLVNGRIVGVWNHARKGRREAEAERLAAFLGGALELRWGAA
jgi:hypothetical protein